MLRNLKIAVVGLGHVGLPVAVAFNQKYPVTGYDINAARIQSLLLGIDNKNETSREELVNSSIVFTTNPLDLREAGFIIVTVPSAIDANQLPDISALKEASKHVGKHMKKGAVVVYETIVAPGMTEESCIPLLEKYSGYENGKEFFVGYSSPRAFLGEKKNGLFSMKKVIASQSEEVTEFLEQVYGSVVNGGIYKAPSIRVAETAKLIENVQRDVNVALINELALICDRLKIDTQEVLATAASKRDFIKVMPSLVGDQEIELASFYLTDQVKASGYESEVILSGRKMNDRMGQFVAQTLIKKMLQQNITLAEGRVTILGISYKEDVPELRNSKVIDIANELKLHGISVQLADPYASIKDVQYYYASDLKAHRELQPAHAVILAVPHKSYKDNSWKLLEGLLIDQQGIVFDIKGVLEVAKKPEKIQLWRL